MRILLVNLAKRFGGVDVRVTQTASHLSQNHAVATITLPGAPIDRELKGLGLETIALDRARHNPRLIADISDAIRQFQPDVVDAHNPQSQLWGMLALRRHPAVGRVATVHTIYRAAHRGGLRQILHERILHLPRRMGAEFLTVSDSISAYLTSIGVDEARIHRSYNALEPIEPPVPNGLRVELDLPPDAVVLAMIGRVEHVKGLDIMFHALRTIFSEDERAHLVIVGSGSLEHEFRERAKDADLAGRVHFLGYRADVTTLLSEIDVLCMPSRSEGLPYTALEAARQGVPMVASKVDGLAEVFEDGQTALLVSPQNPDRHASAVLRLTLDAKRRERIGKAAKALITQDFSIDRMTDETLSVYERAIAARRSASP